MFKSFIFGFTFGVLLFIIVTFIIRRKNIYNNRNRINTVRDELKDATERIDDITERLGNAQERLRESGEIFKKIRTREKKE